MPRSQKFKDESVTLPSGGQLTFPTPFSPLSKTSLSFPPGCTFDSGLHWHETHTEFFSVSKGVMHVILESPSGELEGFYLGKESGVLEIPRGRRHRLRRGDTVGVWRVGIPSKGVQSGSEISREEWEKEVQAQEWTEPRDGRKEGFFRNLGGVVSEPGIAKGVLGRWLEGLKVEITVWAVMGRFDNYPAVLDGRWKGFEWGLVHLLMLLVGVAAWMSGLEVEWEEYTPVELRSVKGGKRKEW